MEMPQQEERLILLGKKKGVFGMQIWRTDQFDFLEFSIRGKEYDVKFFGVQAIKAPTGEAPYWEIEFEDGSKMVTTDLITIRLAKKEKIAYGQEGERKNE